MSNTSLIQFSNVPQVKRPTGSGPLLQWFNGLTAGRELAVGWHVQANRCSEELVEAFRKLGTRRLSVLHKMSGEIVEYWSLEACSLVVLCNGFGDTWEMKQSPDREGLAYGWIEEKQKSKIKARVFVAELAEVGYMEPFTVTLEGMITECFLEALTHQFDVLDAYERITGGQAPFYGFALELAPAEKPKMVGNHGKQSPIIPMVAQVPELIDEEYLIGHVATKQLLKLIADKDLLQKAIAWSVETSRTISRGEDRENWETEEYEAAQSGTGAQPVHKSKHATAAVQDEGLQEEPEPMASPQQVKSMLNLYRLIGEEALPQEVLEAMTFEEARQRIKTMNAQFQGQRKKAAK